MSINSHQPISGWYHAKRLWQSQATIQTLESSLSCSVLRWGWYGHELSTRMHGPAQCRGGDGHECEPVPCMSTPHCEGAFMRVQYRVVVGHAVQWRHLGDMSCRAVAAPRRHGYPQRSMPLFGEISPTAVGLLRGMHSASCCLAFCRAYLP